MLVAQRAWRIGVGTFVDTDAQPLYQLTTEPRGANGHYHRDETAQSIQPKGAAIANAAAA